VNLTDAVTPAQDGKQGHDEIENSELPAVGNPDVFALMKNNQPFHRQL
jgi:hypothetical protein